MSLEFLLIVAFGGAFLTYFFGKIFSKLRDTFAVIISLALVVIISFWYKVYRKNILLRIYGI